MTEKEKLRLDKYLWAIRLFKTRSQAAEACEKGKVKTGGQNAKASRQIHIGDEFEIKTAGRKWVIRVKNLMYSRAQFQEAVRYYDDLTPKEEVERLAYQAASFQTGKRQSKIGRPTKKERRELDDFTSPD